MPDLEISNLPALAGPALQGVDPIPLTDLSASETKKITAKDLIQYGIQFIDDGSIPGDKVTINVDQLEIPDHSITAIKMADNSTGIVAPGPLPNGEYIGQVGLDTNDNTFYVWDGTQWVQPAGAGGASAIDGDDTGLVPVTATLSNGVVTIAASLADTTGAAQFLAGPTDSAGAVSQRAIVGRDLPTASASEKGAITVDGSSLAVVGDKLVIDNNITPSAGTFNVVDVNEQGLVVDYRPAAGGDLPPATGGSIGAVKPGRDLEVEVDGTLNHILKLSSPGSYAKVTVDETGHVTAGGELTADDIPDNIVIGTDQLEECAVTAPKICDYATVLMQEANPGPGDYLGQLWYTPSTAQLRVYARGSGSEDLWLPVGFGNLQANNLRWLGTYNADTNVIVNVTNIGVSEGVQAGDAFPAPSDSLSGGYFICAVAGSNMIQPNLDGINHTQGDWALCLDQSQGWIHLDVNAGGGGGGGGAQELNDLIDVTIGGAASPFGTAAMATLQGDQILRYDGVSGVWRNTDIIDGGSID